jgi:hypothetical protein
VTYGDVSSVRALANNVPPSDVSDATIAGYINAADSLVKSLTRKDDWAAVDDEFQTIQQLSNFYAASLLLANYKDVEQKGKTFREEFYKIIEQLFGTQIVVVQSSNYRTSPLNPALGPIPGQGQVTSDTSMTEP